MCISSERKISFFVDPSSKGASQVVVDRFKSISSELKKQVGEALQLFLCEIEIIMRQIEDCKRSINRRVVNNKFVGEIQFLAKSRKDELALLELRRDQLFAAEEKLSESERSIPELACKELLAHIEKEGRRLCRYAYDFGSVGVRGEEVRSLWQWNGMLCLCFEGRSIRQPFCEVYCGYSDGSGLRFPGCPKLSWQEEDALHLESHPWLRANKN